MTPDPAFVDVAWCEYERLQRTSFAYGVLNRAETIERGCVYVLPCKKDSYVVECGSWVRENELAGGFDAELERWFKAGLIRPGPSRPTAWRGRARHPWELWKRLPEDG